MRRREAAVALELEVLLLVVVDVVVSHPAAAGLTATVFSITAGCVQYNLAPQSFPVQSGLSPRILPLVNNTSTASLRTPATESLQVSFPAYV